jgi:nucleoid-associated protein YgaU
VTVTTDLSPQTAPAEGTGPAVGRTAAHRVRPGDSLWAIASHALLHEGTAATDAAVAAEWPRWYAANRHVVGPDPDLIRPGQVLQPPTDGDRR